MRIGSACCTLIASDSRRVRTSGPPKDEDRLIGSLFLLKLK